GSTSYCVCRAIAPIDAVTVRDGRGADLPAVSWLAFLGRGEALVERPRPESFSRWTLPITALRLTPPRCAAIWLALSPSAQSFRRSSTRSSFQFIRIRSSTIRAGIGILPRPAKAGWHHIYAGERVRRTKSCYVGNEITPMLDSVTRVSTAGGIGFRGFPQLGRADRIRPVASLPLLDQPKRPAPH